MASVDVEHAAWLVSWVSAQINLLTLVTELDIHPAALACVLPGRRQTPLLVQLATYVFNCHLLVWAPF
jgi:hypothetical protein